MAKRPQSREAIKRTPPSVEPIRAQGFIVPAPVQVRAIKPDEITPAVRLLLKGNCSAHELPTHITRFLAMAAEEGYDLSRQMVVETGGELTYACLYVLRPGRMSYVFTAQPGRNPSEAVEALRQLSQWAFKDGSRYLQILLEPNQPQRAELSLLAGYRRLTDLYYLACRLNEVEIPAEVPYQDIDWRDYDDAHADLFRRTIAETYIQSLDCPELAQIRSLEDTFSGFLQETGSGRCLWRLLRYQGKPAGVLLLTRLKQVAWMELTYMGIVPALRGRGWGRLLLEEALRMSRQNDSEVIMLAVDQRNHPARRLYQQFGFNEMLARQIFYETPAY